MNSKKGWLSGKQADDESPEHRDEQQITEAQKRAAEEAGRTGGVPLPPGQVATTPVATEANPQLSDDPTDPNAPVAKAYEGSSTVDLRKLWQWRKRVELGGPRSADWEEFDQIVRPTGDHAAARETVSQRSRKSDDLSERKK